MELPSGYVKLPVTFLLAETPALVNIFVYMPLNKKVVLFRKRGDLLTLADVMQLKSQTTTQLLVPKSEYAEGMQRLSEAVTASFDSGSVVGAATQEMASGFLQVMNVRDPNASTEVKGAPLNDAAELAQFILTSAQGPTNCAYYDKLLSELKAGDELATHNRHVGALSAMLMMALGGYSMANVNDITFAGFFHDLFLKTLPEPFWTAHLNGEDLGTQLFRTPELNYYSHIEQVLNKFDAEKVPATPSAMRMIVQHHENYDGSGLKGARGEAIYPPARLLRISDDLICLVNSKTKQHSLSSAYNELKAFNKSQERPLYDPDLLQKLEPIFR